MKEKFHVKFQGEKTREEWKDTRIFVPALVSATKGAPISNSLETPFVIHRLRQRFAHATTRTWSFYALCTPRIFWQNSLWKCSDPTSSGARPIVSGPSLSKSDLVVQLLYQQLQVLLLYKYLLTQTGHFSRNLHRFVIRVHLSCF